MDDTQFGIPFMLTALAGLSTAIGSFVSLFIREMKKSYLQFFLGISAGVMIYVSFVELLPQSVAKVGFFNANAALFFGIVFILAIDFFIPHYYIGESVEGATKHARLMTAGMFTAWGIGIHNLPEGMVVFISTVGDIRLGIPLAMAIALHNIPEGIAIAMPIFYATQSRKKAFWYSFWAGLAEPLGAVIAVLLIIPFLSSSFLFYLLAFVAGIMIFISFDELLPLSYEQRVAPRTEHLSILGVVLGMLIMAFNLWLF
ncbi:MAG: zinc transporter ZupT [Candidatus Omnitrophica bacterium]|nr:zinc transporter ZupT [Candidatus Omnitrophota bacterium]